LLYVQCSSLLEAKFNKSVIELGAIAMLNGNVIFIYNMYVMAVCAFIAR